MACASSFSSITHGLVTGPSIDNFFDECIYGVITCGKAFHVNISTRPKLMRMGTDANRNVNFNAVSGLCSLRSVVYEKT